MVSLKIFLVVCALWNAYVFMMMGRDKRRAKRHQWRTPEASLLMMGAALGGVGLYAGMKYFRHKTNHSKFVIGAPILLVGNVLVIGFMYYAGYFPLNIF